MLMIVSFLLPAAELCVLAQPNFRASFMIEKQKSTFWKKGAIIHHLKVVHCVLPKAPCRELMIFTQDKPSAPIIQWKLHFPCAG